MEFKAESKGEANHVKKYQHVYAEGVLTPDIHRQLVEDLDGIAASARIPPRCIYKSAKGVCTQAELDWAKNFRVQREQGIDGMVYTGAENVMPRMMALTGIFLRNFINAKLYPVQDLCALLKTHSPPPETVVVVPNFFVGKSSGGDIASWQVSYLLGWLYDRKAEGKSTVVAVESMASMKVEYGRPFFDLIKESYIEVV